MRLDRQMSRAMVIVVAAGLAAACLASPATAAHWVRYKGGGGPRVVRTVAAAPVPVYWSGRSYGAPTFASFVGGIIVGTALAQAVQPHPVVVAAPPVCAVPPPPPCDDDYYYYDPWCHERFYTLEAYDEHLRFERHPAMVRVIDERSGRCIGERAWIDGRWCDRGDWDDDDDR